MSEQQHPLNALPQGHRLQEYELMRVLGFGGFGMTYLGFDHNLKKNVAIKEYLPASIAIRTADRNVAPQASAFRGDFQSGLERSLGEARALARFDHRRIIKVYRFFEAHGTAYIVMEYAEGETLSAFLTRKGPLREAELKAILYPLLDGLEVVHKANLLHRDIKPANIVLRAEDDSPVLLDFGAARQAIGVKSLSVIVTPEYAPIEQYSSQGHQGAWTDLYALGGVCYRALTGQVPGYAPDRVRHDPLVPVSQRCAGRASAAFLSAIDAALAVDEGARPQSVAAWREAMEGAAGAEKDAAEDATSVGRVEPDAPPLERPRALDPVLNDDEQQRQEQAFVAEVGRKPDPKGKYEGATDLHIAARLNLPVLTQSLLTQGADVHAKDNTGFTPLHVAAQEDASATAEVLLKQDANVHAKDNTGFTPLHVAAQEDASATAEVLLKQDANVHAKDNYGFTPLHRAAQEDASATAEVLLKQDANVHAKDNYGFTPLHRAAQEDASATAEVLLKQDANVHAKDNYGWTPLHWAAQEDASATAEVLLKQDANVHAKDNYGWTPLHRAAFKDASAVAEMLLNRGADIHAQANYGRTPLHVAAFGDASSVAEVLLNRGADIHAQDNYGRTPLHVAAFGDASATAQVLLDNGAEVNAKNNYGNTPLHRAAFGDASATAQVLLDNGAEVNAKNNYGNTPLHRARGASATAAVLRRYGARK